LSTITMKSCTTTFLFGFCWFFLFLSTSHEVQFYLIFHGSECKVKKIFSNFKRALNCLDYEPNEKFSFWLHSQFWYHRIKTLFQVKFVKIVSKFQRLLPHFFEWSFKSSRNRFCAHFGESLNVTLCQILVQLNCWHLDLVFTTIQVNYNERPKIFCWQP